MKDVSQYLKIILDFLIENTPIEKLPVCDGIFVFGNIEPRLAVYAAYLWRLGKAPKIILTGKSGVRAVPAGFEDEADYLASIVEKYNVPHNCLILEKNSTNSLENIIYGMKRCEYEGFYPDNLILCAVPALLKRAIATFRRQFPEISVYGSIYSDEIDEYLSSRRRLERVLGEFDRFEKYSRKGDIEPVFVPGHVRDAILKVKLALNSPQ